MKATEFILDALRQEEIDHLFLVPGGLLDPFLTAFGTDAPVKPIVAAHEGGAAYMADGYGRAKGTFGVCMAIGGPGVANMVCPISAAFSDGMPMLVIGGEIATDFEGRGSFQDASPAGMNDLAFMSPVTAYALQVPVAGAVPHHLHGAMRTMLGMEQRPVYLTLPTQVQEQEITEPYRPVVRWLKEPPRILDADAMAEVGEKLKGATNIAILAGFGASRSQEDHPLSLGVFGYSGTRHATDALLGDDIDVLLVLGSSLNQRDTMVWNKKLEPRDCLIQVDLNTGIFDRNYPVDMSVVGDIREVLRWIAKEPSVMAALEASRADRRHWVDKILEAPRRYDAETRESDAVPMHPARVITEARKAMPRDTVALIDSGAHRAFAGHHWDCYGPGAYLSSNTLAPMGWAIPAGVGAQLARPDAPCLVITGDGCMGMHGMEIRSAAMYGVRTIFLVINNGALGNVYLRAKDSESGRSLTQIGVHDWAGLARALGADGLTVSSPDELPAAFEAALAADGPFVIDARCDPEITTPIAPWSEAKKDWIDDH